MTKKNKYLVILILTFISFNLFSLTVTYDGNASTSGTVPTDATNYSSGATVTVLGNTGSLSRIGYNFIGWNTQADGLGLDRPISSTFTITSNTILYAKWQTALPVLLINYKMECEGKKVKIFWTTATEINNDYFTIEKSIDAINFFKAGIIDGAGNSNKQNNYEFFDFINSNQQYYYRLKQTDFNGDYTYSNVISVYGEVEKNEIKNIHPNPTTSNLSFEINSIMDDNILIEIYDCLGRLIISQNKIVKSGISSESIITEELNKGIYMLKISFKNSELKSVTKIVKN